MRASQPSYLAVLKRWPEYAIQFPWHKIWQSCGYVNPPPPPPPPFFLASGKSFTLESIIGMGLDQFADEISDISGAASKELAIEQALAAIGEQWKDLVLDIERYKDRGHHRLK